MNLFLLGWAPSGGAQSAIAGQALAELLARLPFFDSEAIECWQAPSGHVVLAYVGHDEGRVGGVRYVDVDEEGMALFSGRPFLWTRDGSADGRTPLDPRFYRRPAGDWTADLDGRWAAARYDDRERELEVYSDPLGAYPIFSGNLDATRWISNSAELVRTALGADELDDSVLACVLGCGYSLSGDPIWASVKRLPRGTVLRMRAGRPDTQTELLPLDRIAVVAGAGFEPDQAARDLVAATGALADWPGRPNLLQLSGGRDSRLVFGAALKAGVEFDVVTSGTPEAPDVQVARLLCEGTGKRPRLLSPDPGGALIRRTRHTASVVGRAAAGALSIEVAAGYPIEQSTGRLPLWLGGQGGEISRAYYGRGNAQGRLALARQLISSVAGSAELLSSPGRERLERQVGRALDEELAAGVAPEDVPDVFYLLARMGSWAASGFGCVEYAKGDSVTPLWCKRLLPQQLGPRPEERAREWFHTATLEALSPRLARAPYADYTPLLRPGTEELFPVCELVQQAVQSQADHPAWEVLERRYVEQLLARDPRSLDEREHRHVWRLATVFLNDGMEQPR
jgi:hypothetical protein